MLYLRQKQSLQVSVLFFDNFPQNFRRLKSLNGWNRVSYFPNSHRFLHRFPSERSKLFLSYFNSISQCCSSLSFPYKPAKNLPPTKAKRLDFPAIFAIIVATTSHCEKHSQHGVSFILRFNNHRTH